jgi:hypothetical protein
MGVCREVIRMGGFEPDILARKIRLTLANRQSGAAGNGVENVHGERWLE